MKKILLLLLIIPTVLVFRNLLLINNLSSGDAPNFIGQEIVELTKEPLSWTNRGVSFGGPNSSIWISPLLMIYGNLNKLLGINGDILLLVIFYLPSIILSVVGSYKLASYLKTKTIVKFFTVFIYTLNTYFILLIDGGQVGVALAYGLFPFSVLFIKKYSEKNNLKNFICALIFFQLITIADPRIAIISYLTIFIWSLYEYGFNKINSLINLLLPWLFLNLYWIYPLIKNSNINFFSNNFSEKIRWYYPVSLFSPHWPENVFGKTIKPPVYFGVIPLLIFLNLLFIKQNEVRNYLKLFLSFVVLALGILSFEKLPFGYAFRDSTKFFIPIVLFAGLLIGNIIQNIILKFPKFKNFIFIFFYFYLIFLLKPAIFGELNFVLSGKEKKFDISTINNLIINTNGQFRSLWLPERSPTTFEINEKPAVDAKDLTNFLPFSSINASEDIFNFLNFDNYSQSLKNLGIRYIVVSGNPRELNKTEAEKKDWETINELINKNKKLTTINLNTGIQVYEIKDANPRIFFVKRLNGVIGSVLTDGNMPANAIYFEDGKTDPTAFDGKDKSSLNLYFNNSNKDALTMSFLQKYFISPKDAFLKEWAVYDSAQYLKYKYELLIRQIKFQDLDFGKGISFSTKKGEKMQYKFDVSKTDDYVFAYRSMSPGNNQKNLEWNISERRILKGTHFETIENKSEIEILNVVALIPKKDYEEALKKANIFMEHFPVINSNDKKLFDEGVTYLDTTLKSTLKYDIALSNKSGWLIFSENYNPLWSLKFNKDEYKPMPVYSMINGFYVESNWNKVEIEYLGQRNFRIGLYFSFISVLVIILYCLLKSTQKKEV